MRKIAVVPCAVVVGMSFVFACVGDDVASGTNPGTSEAGPDVTSSDAVADSPSNQDVSTLDAPVDAPPPPRCDVTKPFGTALPVDGISTGLGEQGVSLSPDELTAYFSREGSGANGFDLFIGKRTKITDPFTSVILDGYDATTQDFEPTVSADGLTLVFWSARGGTTGADLFQAVRTLQTVAFDPATVIGTLQTGNAETAPNLRADGKILYFSSNRDPAADLDIYRSVRQGDGVFLQPTIAQQNLLANVNSTAIESYPVISDDELTIYFASTRTDLAHTGLQDIFVARRTSTAMPFGTPQNVAELNTASEDVPNWVTPDGCAIYFTSSRPNGAGSSDIYVARRPL